MRRLAMIRLAWKDPLQVLGAAPDDAFALGLISSDDSGWSYVAWSPVEHGWSAPSRAADPFSALPALLGDRCDPEPAAPPFSGGIVGLAAYGGHGPWTDAILLGYSAVLAFDHARREVIACGRGETNEAAEQAVERARQWWGRAARAETDGVLAADVIADDPRAFEINVQIVRDRIAAGEIYQANIARRWAGALAKNARPFDVFARLCRQSPAPFCAYLRLPGLALVSNSPERFISVNQGVVETRPIKGTAPRDADPVQDAANARALEASAKDRAENLMIVDLMRNDLSRVCVPGSVEVPELCRLESFANVHHLVSTVRGTLARGRDSGDLLRAVFPPGSITGAPKVQAMKVIAELEPPRGPFFGSLFWAGYDGAFDSSVLIRTLAFEERAGGWTFEARAGGGIVADSDPVSERIETEDKIAAILRALTEAGS